MHLNIINKPWGYEFTLFQNDNVLVTYLHLRNGSSTSLHCHPSKRTGYIVLSGEVEVEFLAEKKFFSTGDKVNFRPGLFHRTRSLSSECIVLEIESPPNKNDLLRLEDSFGRTQTDYESSTIEVDEVLEYKYKNYIAELSDKKKESEIYIGEYKISRSFIKDLEYLFMCEKKNTIISILNKPIKGYANKKKFPEIVRPGDVTTVEILERMKGILCVDTNYEILAISKK
jgi:mannose-6-phosphate isomerase-like protein (cupin superfamily)